MCHRLSKVVSLLCLCTLAFAARPAAAQTLTCTGPFFDPCSGAPVGSFTITCSGPSVGLLCAGSVVEGVLDFDVGRLNTPFPCSPFQSFTIFVRGESTATCLRQVIAFVLRLISQAQLAESVGDLATGQSLRNQAATALRNLRAQILTPGCVFRLTCGFDPATGARVFCPQESLTGPGVLQMELTNIIDCALNALNLP